LVKQSSQRIFALKGHHDILVVVIGRPKHLGRVRGAGSGVGIRQIFFSSCQSSCSNNADCEKRLTKEITKKVIVKVMRQFESYGIR